MATEVGICNSALIKLGVETISALNENTRQAKLCNEQYAKLRDKLLYAHPWNFAMKKAELEATGEDVLFEFEHEHELPEDCLRVWSTEYPDETYQVEGGLLYSDSEDMKIKYVSKVEDPTLFSPAFSECLSLMIAEDLCHSLVQSNSLKATIQEELRMALREARSFDGQENPAYDLEQDTFLNARY